MKIKALTKDSVEIYSAVLSSEECLAQVTEVRKNGEEIVGKTNSVQLKDDSREVI